MSTDVPIVREKVAGPAVKQFSVFLLNKVGALLEIVKLLNEHEIHVLALNSQDSTDSALSRLIVIGAGRGRLSDVESGRPIALGGWASL